MIRLPSLTALVALTLAQGCRGDTVEPLGEVADASSDGLSDSVAADTAAPGDASGPNLLKDGAFDLGCVNWREYYSVLSDDSVARSPSKACRACRTTAEFFFVAQSISGALPKGQRYLAKAWVRSTDDTSPPATVGWVIEGTDAKDVVVEYVEGAKQPVAASWTLVQAVLETKTGAAIEMRVRVGASYASGKSCFIIDDASVERIE